MSYTVTIYNDYTIIEDSNGDTVHTWLVLTDNTTGIETLMSFNRTGDLYGDPGMLDETVNFERATSSTTFDLDINQYTAMKNEIANIESDIEAGNMQYMFTPILGHVLSDGSNFHNCSTAVLTVLSEGGIDLLNHAPDPFFAEAFIEAKNFTDMIDAVATQLIDSVSSATFDSIMGLGDSVIAFFQHIAKLGSDFFDSIDRFESVLSRTGDWLLALQESNSLWLKLREQGFIPDSLRDLFFQLERSVFGRDPLILDLDGDGIETVATDAGILFDHTADGLKQGTGWVAADDGLLVLDIDGNGTIDSGRELFGDNTLLVDGTTAEQGFVALKDHDSNGDGLINANDDVYNQLQVWQDINQDGISQANELTTLTELGITSINVEETENVNVNQNGNQISMTSSFIRNGEEYEVGQVNYSADTFHSNFTDTIEISEQVQNLPDMSGSGSLRDLREAATLNSDLANALESFSAATTAEEQKTLLDELLFQWSLTADTGTLYQQADNFNSTNTKYPFDLTLINAQSRLGKINVIEAFMGRDLPNVLRMQIAEISPEGSFLSLMDASGEYRSDVINLNYDTVFGAVYSSLVLQTRLKPYIDGVELTYTPEGKIAWDASEAINLIEASIAADETNGLIALIELTKYSGEQLLSMNFDVYAYLDGIIDSVEMTEELTIALSVAGLKSAADLPATGPSNIVRDGSDVFIGSDNDEDIYTGAGNDLMYGRGGNDILSGGAGDDALVGGVGNDILRGGSGDDILIGGTGDDTLDGGEGNTTYLFGLGDGKDKIFLGGNGNKRIHFKDGITPDDITLVPSENHLYINIGGGNDQIELSLYFSSDLINTDLIEFEFSDGAIWDSSTIKQVLMTGSNNDDRLLGQDTDDVIDGLQGNDDISGEAGNDTITGGEGADVLNGDEGNDQLFGGEGADYIYGNNGDDTVIGGIGNDRLFGGAGKNTFIFNLGDGQDVIRKDGVSFSDDNFDTLRFGEGISPNDLSFKASRHALLIYINGTNDQLHLSRYGGFYPLDKIEFFDGTSWDKERIVQALTTGTLNDDFLRGNELDNVINGLSGNDMIGGGEGNDTIAGGTGNDEIDGDGGNDVISGDAGNDEIDGGNGNDTIAGGTGNDVISGDYGNDTITGGEGDDSLRGDDGDDILIGGQGNDTFGDGWGNLGNDIYRFSLGDGQDKITDNDGLNTIEFDVGISSDMVRVTLGNVFNRPALILTIGSSGDSITMLNWEGDTTSILESVVFTDGTVWSMEDVAASLLQATDGDDTFVGNNANDEYNGLAGNDRIEGNGGNDILDGGEGTDILSGGNGNDILRGGTGIDDSLKGGEGDDIYQFSLGDGNTTLNNLDTSTGIDTLQFMEGIAANDISTTRIDNQLYLTVNSTGDVITVEDAFHSSNNYVIDRVTFTDGTSWDWNTLKALTLQGTDGDDIIQGFSSDDVINTGIGNDTIYGLVGNDSLDGGAGSDQLYGNSGNDTLRGGTGTDDYLEGGEGSDTYIFALGDGNTTVNNLDTSTGIDTLQFMEGIVPSDVIAKNDNGDLILTLVSSGEVITVLNAMQDDAYLLDQVKFADGTLWDNDALNAMVLQTTDGDDNLVGFVGDDIIDGGLGNDIISGAQGNDTLLGGAGNDLLQGDSGDDQLFGGDGNDTLEAGDGADILDGGAGDDTLISFDDIYDTSGKSLTGGTGNDTIYGSFGDDTYQFNLGDGQDTIIETRQEQAYSNFTASNDTLTFGEGISVDDLSFERHGDDILIKVAGDADSITIENWFKSYTDHFLINNFQFNNGTSLTVTEVNDLVVQLGTNDDEQLVGSASDDRLSGLGGDDQLFGQAGNDTLLGGLGNDYLDGGTGNDRLEGGVGNDQLWGKSGDDLLIGGAGDDAYVIGVNEGHDILNVADGGQDIIYLQGINKNQFSFSQDGDDLLIKVGDGINQSIRVLNHFLAGEAAIDTIQTGDNQLLSTVDINQLVNAGNGDIELGLINGTDANEQLTGSEINNTINGLAGDDHLFGLGGDDTLNGGLGNDTLTGGLGNDSYVIGVNAGHDQINTADGGVDTIIFDGISLSQVNFEQVGDDLLLLVDGGSNQSVRVLGYFNGGEAEIDVVQFSGNEQLSTADINQIIADKETDTGNGNGDGGETTTPATGGDDQITGSAGNDILVGGAGNDRLTGGKGNDLLLGGHGDDVFIFAKGDGQDIIDVNTGVNSIEFASDISWQDVAYNLSKYGNDLVLKIAGGPDQVTIKDFFIYGSNVLNDFKFADGSNLTPEQIFGAYGLPVANATPPEGVNVIFGDLTDNIINGTDSNDVLNGQSGDDTLVGGLGNDILIGGQGDDIFVINNGDGQDTVELWVVAMTPSTLRQVSVLMILLLL